MTKTFDVAICRFPGDGWERHELTTWLIRTVGKMKADLRIGRIGADEFVIAGETPITIARNRAVRRALDGGYNYILMCDSDMAPDLPREEPFWDVAWKFMMDRRSMEDWLLAHGSTVGSDQMRKYAPPATIGAPYAGPPPHENVYVFEWKGFESDDPDTRPQLDMFTREQAASRTGIEEVAALPTGLILYDARVFEILPPPWFDYDFDKPYETKKETTEDVFQTRNAHCLGLPQYVAWQCWAGHVKTKTVGRPQYITKDQVHHSLVRAVERNLNRGERITIVDPKLRGYPLDGVCPPDSEHAGGAAEVLQGSIGGEPPGSDQS